MADRSFRDYVAEHFYSEFQDAICGFIGEDIDCQRRRGFVVFRRTENVEKWRVKMYSL